MILADFWGLADF